MGLIAETGEGERGGRGRGGDELDYFRPKRAMELLAEGAQLRGGGVSATGGGGSLANSASVHGLESLLAGDTGSSWKRGRLQSLPPPSSGTTLHPSHHSVPQPGPQVVPHHDVLETVERKKSKWRSLEPLDNRRPPPP